MKSVRAFVTINHNKKLDFSSDASIEEINTAVEEYARNLVSNMEDTKYEVSWKWNSTAEAIEKAKEQIVVGAEFKGIDKTINNVWKATIIKVAPEKVRLLYKGIYLSRHYDCTVKNQVTYEEKTGNIAIDRLINFIRDYKPDYLGHRAIDFLIKNKHRKKVEFIDVKGTPEEILKNL